MEGSGVSVGVGVCVEVGVKLGVKLGDGIGVSVDGGKGVEVIKPGLGEAWIVGLRLTAVFTASAFPQATKDMAIPTIIPSTIHLPDLEESIIFINV